MILKDTLTVKELRKAFEGIDEDTKVVIGYGSKILVFTSQDGKLYLVPLVETREEWRKRCKLPTPKDDF